MLSLTWHLKWEFQFLHPGGNSVEFFKNIPLLQGHAWEEGVQASRPPGATKHFVVTLPKTCFCGLHMPTYILSKCRRYIPYLHVIKRCFINLWLISHTRPFIHHFCITPNKKIVLPKYLSVFSSIDYRTNISTSILTKNTGLIKGQGSINRYHCVIRDWGSTKNLFFGVAIIISSILNLESIYYIINDNVHMGVEFPSCLTWPEDHNVTSVYWMASNFGE